MERKSVSVSSAGSLRDAKDLAFPVILALFVLVTRILFRGALYFADGPNEVRSIAAKTYIIQPPGYWLYDRLAGLFPDPVLAMAVMNILFSAAGVVVFYYAACFLTSRLNAFLAALAYSTIFYVWFSGEIHSTYASQILFPVATFYLLLRYERDRAKWLLWLAALIFATGAGLRPSDGVFMIPMLLYFAGFRMPRKEGIAFLLLAAILCLGWFVPTWLAYRSSAQDAHHVGAYVSNITSIKSTLHGVNSESLANITRYVFPLLVGLWPVLAIAVRNAVRGRKDWRVIAMLLWIIPGSLFFVLIFISDSPYLNFLTAAILLLAASAPRMMVATAAWNAVVFLALSPVPSHKLAVNMVNCYALKYTRAGIKQRYTASLSCLQHTSSCRIRGG